MIANVKLTEPEPVATNGSEAEQAKKAYIERWERVYREILPRIVRRLTAKFPYLRFAISVESQAQSAACHCFRKELLGSFIYSSDAELERYITMTTCSKVVGKLKKERLDRRVPLELIEAEMEAVVDNSCEEAAAKLAQFRELLDEDEKLVFDYRLGGMTMPEIVETTGRLPTAIGNLRRSIERKAKRETASEENATND